MAVDLLLLLGEGRRREPRRLAAEVPVALLLLLGEGRRHEPRGLAAEVPNMRDPPATLLAIRQPF